MYPLAIFIREYEFFLKSFWQFVENEWKVKEECIQAKTIMSIKVIVSI